MTKTMIKEAYVSFEVAKLLKEKGFDEPCVRFAYQLKDRVKYGMDKDCPTNTDLKHIYTSVWSMPTHQMAMAWLREVHHIAINIGWGEIFEDKYQWWSTVINMDNGDLYDEHYSASYEESVEDTLKYCLEKLI